MTRNVSPNLPQYNAGTLAYLDTFEGLVPCKVLSVDPTDLTIRLTATRGAYKRGETLTRTPRYVVPRNHVHVRGGIQNISTNYRWI